MRRVAKRCVSGGVVLDFASYRVTLDAQRVETNRERVAADRADRL